MQFFDFVNRRMSILFGGAAFGVGRASVRRPANQAVDVGHLVFRGWVCRVGVVVGMPCQLRDGVQDGTKPVGGGTIGEG